MENYLRRWEQQVSETPGLTKEEKSRLLLSKQTLLGWKITGNTHFFRYIDVKDQSYLKKRKLIFLIYIYPKTLSCLQRREKSNINSYRLLSFVLYKTARFQTGAVNLDIAIPILGTSNVSTKLNDSCSKKICLQCFRNNTSLS